MKKLTFILIILILTLILISSSGCFIQKNIEFNKAKEEIIKFDEEYWNLAQELQKKSDEYRAKIGDLPNEEKINSNENTSIIINKLTTKIELKNKIIEIKNDNLEYYLTYVNNFKALIVPAQLDNFYYEKIKQFGKMIVCLQKEILAVSNDLKYLENYRNDAQNNFASGQTDNDKKVAEERDKLYKESEDIFQEVTDLNIECDKIRREVYREYGLDDLITKWQ